MEGYPLLAGRWLESLRWLGRANRFGAPGGCPVEPAQALPDPVVVSTSASIGTISLAGGLTVLFGIVTYGAVFQTDGWSAGIIIAKIIAACFCGSITLIAASMFIFALLSRGTYISIGSKGICCRTLGEKCLGWDQIKSVSVEVEKDFTPKGRPNRKARMLITPVAPDLLIHPDLSEWRIGDGASDKFQLSVPKNSALRNNLYRWAALDAVTAALARYAGDRFLGVWGDI